MNGREFRRTIWNYHRNSVQWTTNSISINFINIYCVVFRASYRIDSKSNKSKRLCERREGKQPPAYRTDRKILKLIIGLTIFRRWRAVHGAEEHPSPSGFAMVFQKAPFSPKNSSNTAAAKAKNDKSSNRSTTAIVQCDASGPTASLINNNVHPSSGTASSSTATTTTTPSTGRLKSMVITLQI